MELKNQNLKPIRRTKKQRAQTTQLAKKVVVHRTRHLQQHSDRNTSTLHINYKIYHLLTRPFTFVNAQINMRANSGFLTKGVDDTESINDHFGQHIALSIAEEFRKGTYKPSPVRRVWIEKPGRKNAFRPIDTPTQKDRIVQEAIRGILEAIYEPEFATWDIDSRGFSSNYGFRPGRGCWDAIENIKSKSQGTTWAIEGDFKGAYNSIDHKILLSLLSQRIKDKKFINVIKDFLKCGIMDSGTYEDLLVGVPQGGIVSPLLFNIYMHEFDQWIYKSYIRTVNKSKKKVFNPKYTYFRRELTNTINLIRNPSTPKQQKRQLKKHIKLILQSRKSVPTYIPESIPKFSHYVRYADDWILFVAGPKSEAIQIKSEIEKYSRDVMKMTLSVEKTLITKYTEGINFLGFRIIQWNYNQTKTTYITKRTKRGKRRIHAKTASRQIRVGIDVDRIDSRLILRCYATKKQGKTFPRSHNVLFKLHPYEIVLHYRQVFMGLVNYYNNVDTKRKLYHLEYILRYSCAMTLANREKSSIRAIFIKYTPKLSIHNPTPGSKSTVSFPSLKDMKLQYRPHIITTVDPFKVNKYLRTKFKVFSACCICGSSDKVQLHHTNSLASGGGKAKQKTLTALDMRLKRKQIPVCHRCHVEITSGRYNKESPSVFFDEYMGSW